MLARQPASGTELGDLSADRERLISGLRGLGFRAEIIDALRSLAGKMPSATTPLDWKDCMDLLRAIYEELVEDAAKTSSSENPRPRSHFKEWNDILVKVQILSPTEGELSQKLYNYLSEAGSHRLGSDSDQVRVGTYAVVALGLLIVRRLQASIWLIGRWQGHHAGRNTQLDETLFEVVHDVTGLAWRMTRQTIIRGFSGTLTATGTVQLVTNSTVLLEGAYSEVSQLQTAGRPLTYRLQRKGDRLEGHGEGIESSPFPVSISRVSGCRAR